MELAEKPGEGSSVLGKRARPSREGRPLPLNHHLIQLFHNENSKGFPQGNIERIHHKVPYIYLIHDFFTAKEMTYLEEYCENQASTFQSSFTEDDGNNEIIDDYRTSTFIYMKKSENQFVRRIEERAAKIVSLPSSNIEPLQIVSYTKGQKFDLHHDAGTLDEDTMRVEMVPPRRVLTIFAYLNTLQEVCFILSDRTDCQSG